ncbi:site-specific integrase [Urbifossiella limnaea]|uniref:Uncharacterized protein n=1 Tax=Urbifossiella limnaea TaxID=2528023 RepID=A0A517XWD1_9BACT|nr:hypothetical protein [Urbifossiella limnaea]QDU21813.1 hypothetical protein ETAA1_37860 [Urbifossiella limnaea]
MDSAGSHERVGDTTPSGQHSWTDRYGEKHRWERLDSFPPGLSPPRKVRIYRRGTHHILNWWDPAARKNLSERVEGDLLAVLVRARQVDDRVTGLRSGGVPKPRRLGHDELVARYLDDLRRRADAGVVDPATVARYRAALGHYRAFCEQTTIDRVYPSPALVNRDFQLSFTAFLANREVGGNGRAGAAGRPLRSHRYVLDVVRGVYEWALDPARGGLLPEGFRSPFLKGGARTPPPHGDPLAEPDITSPMAVEFINACDHHQLRLFVPLLLFGLRAAEPCTLFAEHLTADWLKVPCIPELDVLTKGRRDKRFPLLADLGPFWADLRGGRGHGLLLERRRVVHGVVDAPLYRAPLPELIAEYRRRCEKLNEQSAAERARTRDRLLRDAGGIGYDDVRGEFAGLATRLGWPRAATVKDLRHLFATTMNNAAVPESYTRYLMGHAPGRGVALNSYLHLNNLAGHYTEAVRKEWGGLVEAVLGRVKQVAPLSSQTGEPSTGV